MGSGRLAKLTAWLGMAFAMAFLLVPATPAGVAASEELVISYVHPEDWSLGTNSYDPAGRSGEFEVSWRHDLATVSLSVISRHRAQVAVQLFTYGSTPRPGEWHFDSLQDILDEIQDDNPGASWRQDRLWGLSAYSLQVNRVAEHIGGWWHWEEEVYYIIVLTDDTAVGAVRQASVSQIDWNYPADPEGTYARLVDTSTYVLESVQLNPALTSGGTVPGGQPPIAPADENGWRVAVGGAAAVAAAAAALIGITGASTASGRSRPDRSPRDPNAVVGHVLQLSSGEVNCASQPGHLSVQAHAVLANGTTRPATGVLLLLKPPPGVQLSQASNYNMVSTTVTAGGQLPEGAAISVTASSSLGTTSAQVPVINAEPALDARPDRFEMGAGTAASGQLTAWVAPADGLVWQFSAEPLDPPWVDIRIFPEGPDRALVYLVEHAPDGRQRAHYTALTVVLLASAQGRQQLRREVRVTLVHEGLYWRKPGGLADEDAIVLFADGSGRVTEFDLRAFAPDPGRLNVVPDPEMASRAQSVIEPWDSLAAFALPFAGLQIDCVGIRNIRPPSAIFQAVVKAELPTGPDPLRAELKAFIPQRNENYVVSIPLLVRGVNIEPFSPRWELERDRCMHVIDNFVPEGLRGPLYEMVATRSVELGAEGLYSLRKELWQTAYDMLVNQRDNYLAEADAHDRRIFYLEWVETAGDVAIAVLCGIPGYRAVGTSLSILKPLLQEAMRIYSDGGSLEDWARGIFVTLLGVTETAAMDRGTIQMVFNRLSPGSRMKVWAVYISYWICRELYARRSITEAVKAVAWRLTIDLLVDFLQQTLAPKADVRSSPKPAPVPKAPAAPAHAPAAPAHAPAAPAHAPAAPAHAPVAPAAPAPAPAPAAPAPAPAAPAPAAPAPAAPAPATPAPATPAPAPKSPDVPYGSTPYNPREAQELAKERAAQDAVKAKQQQKKP